MTEHDIDRRDAVETLWPYDGPHGPESVQTAARSLERLVRYLNNATQPSIAQHTLAQATSIDGIVSGLEAAVYGLDQLVDQLSAAARTQAARPDVYDARAEHREEQHSEGARKARELAEKLDAIRPLLIVWEDWRPVGGLAVELEHVHSLSARLGNDLPDDEIGG